MKRIVIFGEGQTEQEFSNDVLQEHFNRKEIYLETPTFGGIGRWEKLKYQIEKQLKSDTTAYVTTLIDFYGMTEGLHFPRWNEAISVLGVDREKAMDILEEGMLNDIDIQLRARFIPYIQLYEFEALLYCNIDVFRDNFEESEFADYPYLEETIRTNPNPETINNSFITAPSKRLEKIFKNYSSEGGKIAYGSLLAQEIGLLTIREKCPRFNTWINKLESI